MAEAGIIKNVNINGLVLHFKGFPSRVKDSEEEDDVDVDVPGTSKDIKPPRVRKCRTHDTSYMDGFTRS